MSERISRKADQKVYQPRIHSRRIRELYYVKEMTGRPMTVLVDEAIALYLSSFYLVPNVIQENEQQASDYQSQVHRVDGFFMLHVARINDYCHPI